MFASGVGSRRVRQAKKCRRRVSHARATGTATQARNGAKAQLATQSTLQTQLLTGLIATGPLLATHVPGVADLAPISVNLIISNVPGPREPLYWDGARMQGMYPLSVPQQGQALNITVVSYAGQLNFGLTGCRRRLPHLQHMLTYLEDSLSELETAKV